MELSPLTWNASQAVLPSGDKQTSFGCKHLNYLDSRDKWLNLSTVISDAGSHYFAMGGLFTAHIPKFADEVATFNSELRFDIFKKEKFSASEMQMEMRSIDASHVAGHIEQGDIGIGQQVEYVIYPQAFPGMDADLIYYVHHGRSPRLMKVIRWNGGWKPLLNRGTTDLRFDVSLSEENTLKTKRGLDNTFSEIRSARITKTESDTGFYSKDESRRAIGIRKAKMWGLVPEMPYDDQFKQSITLEYDRINSRHFIVTKQHPNSVFHNNTFPLFSDTTTTVYPDPDTETTTCDGRVRYAAPASWATAQNTTTGQAAFDDQALNYCYCGKNGSSGWFIARTFQGFDTSPVGADTVSSAVLDIYAITLYQDGTDSNRNIAMVQASPASNTSLAVGDYDACGDAVDNPTVGSNILEVSSMSSSAYNSLTADATGRGWINGSGVTNLGLRQGADRTDTEPSIGASESTGCTYNAAETSGTSTDPRLTVTHASASPPMLTLIGVG